MGEEEREERDSQQTHYGSLSRVSILVQSQ